MTKKTINPPPEMEGKITQLQAKLGLNSWIAALWTAVAAGLKTYGIEPPANFIRKRGGWRGSDASLKALMDYADRVSNGGRDDPEHYIDPGVENEVSADE